MLVVATIAVLRGQENRPRLQALRAGGPDIVAAASRVDGMLHDGTLQISRVQSDRVFAGRTHERLAQHFDGLPVFGGELVREMDGGQPLSVFGALYEGVSVPTTEPSLPPAAGAARAEAAAGRDAIAGEPQLGILPRGDGYALVYRVPVRTSWDIAVYDINARTGAVEDRRSRIVHDLPTVGAGTGVLNDRKKVSSNSTSGMFEASDLLRPAGAYTLDFHGSAARLNAFMRTGRLSASDIATSPNNTWTDGAVVDAHVYQGWVYDYYYKRFGRHGLDDHDLDIVGVVHPLARSDVAQYDADEIGTFINNAGYFGDGLMIYGDGDGQVFDYLAGGLDIIGHELTHGVTEFSSNLGTRDEPGALNEAFSDIMGTAIEFFFVEPGKGPQKGPNFVMGEDITRSAPGYIRSLQNPVSAGTPDHYSLRRYIGTDVDDGGVHYNSTIVSHAFYLAVAGGRNRVSGISVQGIGVPQMERMERIFYRAFVFLLGPTAQFSDARAATLQAAAELYGAGSNERLQLALAWDAVGVK